MTWVFPNQISPSMTSVVKRNIPSATRLFPILLLLSAGACRQAVPSYTQLEGKAQGTTFHITYNDASERNFSSPVDSIFRLIDKSMSLWDSTSILSRINRNEPGVIADEHLIKVYQRSQEVSGLTGGAFDITVGPLVKAWGFSYKKGLPAPDSNQVDSLLQLVGFQKIKLENGIFTKAQPDMQIDVNAIAQGYTVDLICDFLEKQGIRDYLVEVGGELRCAGKNERGAPWTIGIDKPLDHPEQERPLQTTIPLSQQALATSGSYRKFVVREGKKYSHAIDPATGYPITHNLLSVSVLAADCTTADAFATAFLVMGTERAMALAKAQNMEIYCIYEDEKGSLQVQSTAGFPQ